jgi:hypothetical protein
MDASFGRRLRTSRSFSRGGVVRDIINEPTQAKRRQHPWTLDALVGEHFICFSPVLADIAGSIEGALMLAKAAYWTLRGEGLDRHGFFQKDWNEWEFSFKCP